MSEIIASRGLGFGIDDRTSQPLGEVVIGRDPGTLLSSPAVFEAGDVVIYNYATADAAVDALDGNFYEEDGVMSNVEVMPAALPPDVKRSIRAAVVLPSKADTGMRSTQVAMAPMNGGVVGKRMRTAASGAVILKAQIPSGSTTLRAGASLVLSPGNRYLEVASGSEERIVARLTHSVTTKPDGSAYSALDVVLVMAELQGDLGFGMDIPFA